MRKLGRRVTLARNPSHGDRPLDRGQIVGCQGQLGPGKRLGEALRGAGADDRADVTPLLALGEHPGGRQLPHRDPAGVGDRAQRLDQREVGLDIARWNRGKRARGPVPPSCAVQLPDSSPRASTPYAVMPMPSSRQPTDLASAVMTALQGGLLLTQTTRQTRHLQLSLDMALTHVTLALA